MVICSSPNKDESFTCDLDVYPVQSVLGIKRAFINGNMLTQWCIHSLVVNMFILHTENYNEG